MPAPAQATRYSRLAMLFHWAIAALFLLEFALAMSFSQFNPGDAGYFRSAYSLHMSVGMAGLALSVLCVLWRLMHRYPPLPEEMGPGMRCMAKGAHLLLYAFILLVPLTGWAVLSLRHSPATLIGSVHWPNTPYLPDLSHAQRDALHTWMLPIHSYVSYCAISLVGVHILAALYHHFYRRDDVLLRMLPGTSIGQEAGAQPQRVR